jgi:hypothetical protein
MAMDKSSLSSHQSPVEQRGKVNEHATRPGEEKNKENKGQGSFRIPEEALNILLKSRAPAWQITVYLTLARFTDESGMYSTAGHDAIYRYTGATPGSSQKPGKGRQLVEGLQKMGKRISPMPSRVQGPSAKEKGGKVAEPAPPLPMPTKLLYTPEDWQRETGEAIPEPHNKIFPVNWVLNDFGGEKWVWFPNELVDGYGRFSQPLLRLKRCGDVAARLLLLLYARNNMEEFGGIPPRPNVYRKYNLEYLQTAHDCTFWKAVVGTQIVYDHLSLAALGLSSWAMKKEKKNEQNKVFSDALFSLLSQGFLAEVVTVMDRDAGDPDARPMYELHFKANGSQPARRENTLAGRIDSIFSKVLGERMADGAGRFYDKFPVLNRIGIKPHVVGIYRLRFQIMNPKNYNIMAAWKRRAWDREAMLELLKNLEERIGIASELTDHPREGQPNFEHAGQWN